MTRIMTLTLLTLLTLTASCRTVRNVKLDRSDEASVQILPWTSDQQSLMESSCANRVGAALKGDVATQCMCLIDEAAVRWSFDAYAANEDAYLNQLVTEGVGATSACKGDDALPVAKEWQAPMSLRLNPDERFYALTPAFTMNPAGDRIAVVWAQDEERGSKASIFAKTFLKGTGWSELRYVDANDSPTSFSAAPRVAFLDDANALVVWQKDDGTLRSIWSARFANGTWENATRLELNVTQSPERLAFAAHPASGQVAVAWSQQSGANKEIRVRRYANGQWQLSEVVDRGTRQSLTPTLHFTADGELIAVWAEARAASDYHVVSNRYAQGAWGVATTLASTGGEFPYSPALASGANKAVALTWLQDARTTDPNTQVTSLATKVMALLRTSTGVWQSTPSVLEREKGGDGFKGAADPSLQVAVDDKNIVHAVWQRQEGALSKLWTARADGARWSTKELLYPNIGGILKTPVLAGSDADLIVGFEQEDGARKDILGASWQGADWFKANALEDIPDAASMAAALSHPKGESAILWTAQPEGGDGNELFISFYRKAAP